MNMKNKIFLLLIVSCSLQAAKQVTMSDKYIRSLSPEQLYQKIKSYKNQGYEPVGESPSSTARLALVYSNLNQDTATLMSVIAQLQATIGQPLGAGGAASGSQGGADAAELERLRRENAALRSSGHGGTTAADVSETQQEELGVEFGAPPPPPPPPPMPGGTVSQPISASTTPTKAPKTAVELVSSEPLDSSITNAQSDACVVEALKQIANEVFIGTTKIEKILTPGLQAPVFKSSFETYIFFIKDRLAALVGWNTKFKKRNEFVQAVGRTVDAGGTLFTLVDDELKASSVPGYFDSSLETFYKEFDDSDGVAGMLAQGLAPLFCEKGELIKHKQAINTIAANIIVSQRPKIDEKKIASSSPIAIRSDGLVEFTINTMISNAMKNPKEDYIVWLYNNINKLRIDPGFLKYEGLIGSEARSAATPKSGADVKAAAKYPLLETLASNSTGNFVFNKLKLLINEQLVFDKETLSDIFSDETAIKALNDILNNHIMHLKAAGASMDIAALIQEAIASAKNDAAGIKALQTLIVTLDPIVGSSDSHIKILKQQLGKDNLAPETVAVSNALNGLSKNNPTYDKEKLGEILTAYREQNSKKTKALGALTAIKTEYEKKKMPIDLFVYEQMKSNEIVQDWKLKEKFNGLDRTAESIPPLFNEVLGSLDPVYKIIPKKLWYKVINSYGLLIKIIRDALIEQALPGESPLDPLVNSIEALSTGTIAGNKHYVPSVAGNRELILSKIDVVATDKHGKAAVTFNDMLAALRTYNIASFNAMIKSYIETANPQALSNAKNLEEFNKLIVDLTNYLIKKIMGDILKQITILNEGSGEQTLPGLALTGISRDEMKRNASVYLVVKNAFKPVLELLKSSEIASFDIANFNEAKEKVLTAIAAKMEKDAQIKEEQRPAINAVFNTYLNSVGQQLQYLKQCVQASEAPSATVDPVILDINAPPPPPPPPPPMPSKQ